MLIYGSSVLNTVNAALVISTSAVLQFRVEAPLANSLPVYSLRVQSFLETG